MTNAPPDPLAPPLPGVAAPLSSLDDPAAAWYTVGQVADVVGVQIPFLRRLDSEELVSPARSLGGQRRYSRAEIGQVQRIAELASEGITLAGIRRLLLLETEVADLKRQLDRERNATNEADL